MRNFLVFVLCFVTLPLMSQVQSTGEYDPVERSAITVGFLQGGGSLLGLDIEKLLYQNIGIQVGFGLVGYGAGVNIHFKPIVQSSFICLQLWNQGIEESFAQRIVGASYVLRARRIFTAQLGLGVPVKTGPAMPEDYEVPPVMLIYSIGLYFPF